LVKIDQGVLAWRNDLRNDLYCVEWGVKLYSLTPFGVARGRFWSFPLTGFVAFTTLSHNRASVLWVY